MLYVRRESKVYEIPLNRVSGNIVMVKLEGRAKRLVCCYGEDKDHFPRVAEFRAGYPPNVQKMKTLLETAKGAKGKLTS